MNNVRKESLKALAGAVSGRGRDSAAESFDELMKKFFASSDKAERERLLADFAAKRSELAEFIESNPDIINAEAERALLEAALKGNANAALRYLEKRDPERWGSDSDDEDFDSTITIVRAGKDGH